MLTVSALALPVVAAGCGANVDALVYQAGSAALNTLVDRGLTGFAGCLAGACAENIPDEGGAEGEGAEGGVDGGGSGAGDEGGATGAVDGAAVFSATCAACHGPDGTGGAVFPGDITGTSAADVTTAQNDLSIHSSLSVTAEEIAAIAEFLGG